MEISKELLDKLLAVKTREEAAALLKAEGFEDVPEETVWEQVQALRTQESRELSLDELDDVAGGAIHNRSWIDEGCAATVEMDSDCWGTDGGCNTVNIDYHNLPEYYCRKCGRWSCRESRRIDNNHIVFKCLYCGEFMLDYTYDKKGVLVG